MDGLVFFISILIVHGIRGASVQTATSTTQPQISQFGYRVIRNSSFPCKKIIPKEAQPYKFHRLDDDDKIAILEAKGGKMVKEYMAKDEREAKEYFPSLLDMDFQHQKKRYRGDWKLPKSVIKHWLDLQQEERNHLEEEDGHGKSQENQKDQDQEHHKVDVKSNSDSPKHRNQTLLQSSNIGYVYVRPTDVGLPDQEQNNLTGEISQLEMCITRGTRTRDQIHLYMCTTCSATTNMGSAYWPPIINEARCITADPYCFIVDDMPHGVCKQKVISMQILKKVHGHCELGLKNGEKVVVDEWIMWDRAVNVGCECVINVHSEFAQYVGRYIDKTP